MTNLMNENDRASFATSVQRELAENLLPFWQDRAVDHERGGFVDWMSQEGIVDTQAPKGLILYARLLWTYAALYRHQGEDVWWELTNRAYDYLDACFWDGQYQGALWELDSQGTLLDATKKVYGQAFVIYALAEAFLALSEERALTRAQTLFHILEDHTRDRQEGGYFEVCTRGWHIQKQARLSDKDIVAPKSMNNHLHLLEAYTHLYRVWPDPSVAASLCDIIDLFRNRLFHAPSGHLMHFFDEQWRPLSTDYTFGHDIEASWLLCEAATVLGDPTLIAQVESMALRLAQTTLDEGIDETGGLCYAGDRQHVTDRNKEWWPLAECVVGFLNAYQLSGQVAYSQAAIRVWRFIETYVVDKVNGEWHWRVDERGHPDPNEPKISTWKGPYHNVRACLEVLQRLQALDKTGTDKHEEGPEQA